MKKLAAIIIFLIVLSLSSRKTHAQETYVCGQNIRITVSENPLVLPYLVPADIHFTIDGGASLAPNHEYYIALESVWEAFDRTTDPVMYNGNPFTLTYHIAWNQYLNFQITLRRKVGANVDTVLVNDETVCSLSQALIIDRQLPSADPCNVSINPNPADLSDQVRVSIHDLEPSTSYRIILTPGLTPGAQQDWLTTDSTGSLTTTFNFNRTGNYSLNVTKSTDFGETCVNDNILTIEENLPDPIPIPCYTSADEAACIAAGCECKQQSSHPNDKLCLDQNDQLVQWGGDPFRIIKFPLVGYEYPDQQVGPQLDNGCSRNDFNRHHRPVFNQITDPNT